MISTVPEMSMIWTGRTAYEPCWLLQRRLHELRAAGGISDVLLLTEHRHTYTTGRRRGADHLLLSAEQLDERGISLVQSDRGGDITYHGPGQLVGYPIVRLQRRHGGVVGYLRRLERALQEMLRRLGIESFSREGLTGVWTQAGKIASIGVRISSSVTLHGFALNVTTDLTYFDGIVACGIQGVSMSSIEQELGTAPSLPELLRPAAESIADSLGLLLRPDEDSTLSRLARDVLQKASGRASSQTLC